MLHKRTLQIISFLKEIEKLKLVWRVNYLSDKRTREDDAQHSWHLAMMILVLPTNFQSNLMSAMRSS